MSIRSLEAPNIKFVSWAPQNDVLGHPSVKAFISHGGSNSMYEAAFHGVPLVCIPFMGDQPDNAAKVRIVSKGMMTQCTVVAAMNVPVCLFGLLATALHASQAGAHITRRVSIHYTFSRLLVVCAGA